MISSILIIVILFTSGALYGLAKYSRKMPLKFNPGHLIDVNNVKPAKPKEPEQIVVEPKFKVGEIVYIKFSPRISTNCQDYPMIGSKYEIDCKIIDLNSSFGSHTYELMSGNGYRILVSETELVAPKDVLARRAKISYSLIFPCHPLPAGALFHKVGEWITNEEFGITFHESYFNQHLNHMFNVVPRASV